MSQNAKGLPKNGKPLRLLASQCVSYFLAPVSVFLVVSVIILLVSVVVGAIVDVSGATVVVVSLLSELLPLLLHAAKEDTMIAIANNFFICRNLRLLTIDFGFIPQPGKR
jgi:hypothetical protein